MSTENLVTFKDVFEEFHLSEGDPQVAITLAKEIVRLRNIVNAYEHGIHQVVLSNVHLEKLVATQSETIQQLIWKVRL